ncbi:hypothetical protein BT69DRAFT_511311 [Atractiella rhizophila]|nr:hypothetical protein BT69DRAFT_511311 [Atractiella rhizophila]
MRSRQDQQTSVAPTPDIYVCPPTASINGTFTPSDMSLTPVITPDERHQEGYIQNVFSTGQPPQPTPGSISMADYQFPAPPPTQQYEYAPGPISSNFIAQNPAIHTFDDSVNALYMNVGTSHHQPLLYPSYPVHQPVQLYALASASAPVYDASPQPVRSNVYPSYVPPQPYWGDIPVTTAAIPAEATPTEQDSVPVHGRGTTIDPRVL